VKVISFIIPGQVSGKGRPKFARRGKFVTAYTPQKTRAMESVVKEYAALAMANKGLLDGPLSLKIEVFQHCPASWSKKRKAAACWVTGKPDADNIIKLIGDSLNGIVWTDDSQIAALGFSRVYTSGPEQVWVTVKGLGDERN